MTREYKKPPAPATGTTTPSTPKKTAQSTENSTRKQKQTDKRTAISEHYASDDSSGDDMEHSSDSDEEVSGLEEKFSKLALYQVMNDSFPSKYSRMNVSIKWRGAVLIQTFSSH